MPRLTLISSDAQPVDETPLDAYSRVVIEVAERLAPSVANLRVSRPMRGRRVDGGGSGVGITPDGFVLTSAPLVDGAGRVVGINTAVAGVGLGLAVPINGITRGVVAALMTDGRVRRAYVGLAGGSRPLPPRLAKQLGRRSAVEVVEVVPGTPAARAGLRPEDLVVALDGTPVTSVEDVQRLMTSER